MKQTKNSELIAYLIVRYTCGSLSERQHDRLDAWVDASDTNMYLFEDLTDERVIRQILDWLMDADMPGILQRLKRRLVFSTN